MKKQIVSLAMVSFALCGSASAGTLLWDFSYSFTGTQPAISGLGVLTTSDVLNSDNSYTITGISGSRSFNGETDSITGLLDAGTYGGNDNELFPAASGPYLDFSGVSFSIDHPNSVLNADKVNLFYNATTYTEAGALNSGSFTISPVPEPATLSLFGLGLTGMALIRRRRASR